MSGSIKLVAALALMTLVLQPVASCFSPEMAQTDEECCSQMAGDCGQVSMPTSHSCCKYVDRADFARPEMKNSIIARVDAAVAPLSIQAVAADTSVSHVVELSTESPPPSFPPSIQILRI